MSALERLNINLLIICLFIYFIKGYKDDEFCHPHCLVTCLPSCQCCDSKDENIDVSAINSRRNQLKLEKLEQILRDKDLEVGIVCRPSCREKCLPSCKFECCRDNTHIKKYKVKKGSNVKVEVGFDLRRLMKSMEETQREYEKLKAFIQKVNGSSSALTGSSSLGGSGFHIVTKQSKQIKNAQPTAPPKGTKVNAKSGYKKKGESPEKEESMELLQQLYDIQEKLDQKEKLKEKVKLRLLDSPYTKLITSKQKLRVEILDDLESPSIKLKKKKIIRKLRTDSKPKAVSKLKEIRQYFSPSKQSHCDAGCKEFCSETCHFECCLTKDGMPSNTTKPMDSNAIDESTNNKNVLLHNENNTTLSKESLFNFTSDQLNSSLPGVNNVTVVSPDTKALLETKQQLESLLDVLKEVKLLEVRNSTADKEICNSTCKKDCTPDCPFKCCAR